MAGSDRSPASSGDEDNADEDADEDEDEDEDGDEDGDKDNADSLSNIATSLSLRTPTPDSPLIAAGAGALAFSAS